jgi:lipopolysaccharide export system permease protein
MFGIIDRHILKGLSASFLIGIFSLTLILLVHQLLRLLSLVLDQGIGLVAVGRVFLFLLPSFLLLTIPMAMMLASIVTFNSLSSDNEITALRAAGIGFQNMLRPTFLFSLAAALLTLYMGHISQPWSGGSFKSLSRDLIQEKSGLGLEAGKFNEVGSGLMIYIEAMRTPSEMQGLFIHDERKHGLPLLIVAGEGTLTHHPETGAITIGLRDGRIHRQGQTPSDHQTITFSRYDFRLDLADDLPEARGLTASELKEKIARAGGGDLASLRLLSEFYKRDAFSAATLLFGILGLPLGVIAGRTGKLIGPALGIGVILLYYVLTMAGDYLVTRQLVAPLAGAWFPHMVLIPFSLVLAICNKSASIRA